MGIEPTSSAWKADILADVLYPQLQKELYHNFVQMSSMNLWSNTTEVIDFLCLSVIPFVIRPMALLSSLMVKTPALKETFRKTQRGDHF